MTGLPQTRHFSIAGARALNFACASPRTPLRALALAMVSHQTLLRAPGPLGMFDMDPKRAAEKRQELDVLCQTAVIVAGMVLGIVFKNSQGKLEVR